MVIYLQISLVCVGLLLGDYRKIKKLPRNFEIYYELFIGDILVTTIYKRKDLL